MSASLTVPLLSRYYLSGISKESTRYGIENYIERKGVKVSHLILFKPKYGGPFLSAKVNVSHVSLQFAYTVESPHFWPDGIKCRHWLSNHKWEHKYLGTRSRGTGSENVP